jgi:hypothetical protein
MFANAAAITKKTIRAMKLIMPANTPNDSIVLEFGYSINDLS